MQYGNKIPAMAGEASVTLQAQPQHVSYAEAAMENRCAPRYQMSIPALLQVEDDVIAVDVTNMSMAGFACDAGLSLPVGTAVELKLPDLPEARHFPILKATVMRSSSGILGCALDTLLEAEQFEPYVAAYMVE